MKQLILVRHGKSSWDKPLSDIDRPLKARAFEDAAHVISAFQAHLDFPLHVFSSPAMRAKTTAGLFKKELDIEDQDFEIVNELYTFNAGEVLHFIKRIEDQLDHVMLFGHNPAYTELVNTLGNLPIGNLPTTGLVSIKFDIDSWKQLNTGQTTLYLFPKNLC